MRRDRKARPRSRGRRRSEERAAWTSTRCCNGSRSRSRSASIVGLERHWKTREQHAGQRLAGLRTFTLAGLLGGALGALPTGAAAAVAAGALVLGALVVGGYVTTAHESRDFGMTTELALLTTFVLGALATLGAPFSATAAAVAMALLLGLKTEFHRVIEQLDRHELLATLQLLALAAVLVPLLPDRDLGPWNSLNPRTIGMLVLLIAGLSYVGYFAVRLLGDKLGLLLTAVLGGLTSSTAVTVAYARRARSAPADVPLLGAGIALASATMVPRLALEIAAVHRPLLATLWPTLAALALVPLAGVAIGALRGGHRGKPAKLHLTNPLQLAAALGFGALLAVLFVAAEGLKRAFGVAGTYAIAATAGLLDVDAISLALAHDAARGALGADVATRGIAVAVLVNTGVKAMIAAVLGGLPVVRSASAVLGAAVVAGAIAALLTLLIV